MTIGQKKTTSHCGWTSCTLVKVSASIVDYKHIAKTQATLARASTNLETPRKRLSYVQKELKKINLCKELARAEAQLKKRRDKEAQRWQNDPEVAHDCQRSRINQQRHSLSSPSYLLTSSDKLHLSQKHFRESEQAKDTPKIEKYEGKTWRQYYTFVDSCITAFCYKPILAFTKKDKILFAITRMDRKIMKLWNCYEKNHDIHTLKWNNFTIFLKDTLETPIHCNQTIATCYKEARQKPGQAVTDFVLYLDRLKDELSPYNDKACLQHLKTKLQPKITNKMIAWPNPPKTCQEAIDLAIWLEQVEPSCKPKATTTR